MEAARNTAHLTEALARFAVETPAGAIPETAYEKAAKAIVDTVGCILAGSVADVSEPLQRYLGQIEGEGARPKHQSLFPRMRGL